MIHGHGDDLYAYPGGIRLNFSSNILSQAATEWVPPAVASFHEGLRCHLSKVWKRLGNYPEPEPWQAEAAIAEWHEVSPDEVMLTNGATEAIYLIAQMGHGLPYDIVEPTFSEYRDAMERRVACSSPFLKEHGIEALCWLCNPNNPTGQVMPKGELELRIRNHPSTLFVIDQSYERFTLEPLFTACEACAMPNVVLLHSMTKQFGLPGLRLGYITAAREMVSLLRGLRWPWAVGTLAAEAACYLIRHTADYALPLPDILKERSRMSQALTATGTIDVYPSQTHMLLCRLHTGTAAQLKEQLATRHGILIRDASNFRGLTPAHFRIAVQGRQADDELLRALEASYVHRSTIITS